MMEKVLICVLDLYYSLIEAIFLSFTVLRIKFKRPNHQKSLTEPKGHLALRLNDGRVLSSSDLFDLIDYCKGVFGVKYLTLIAGSGGFEREIDIREHLSNSISIYNNYQFLYTSTTPSPKIHVNLVDNDSSSLFLLKLKETIETTHESTGLKVQQKEILYQSALKSFTNFPPIDLFLCMTHNLNFTGLFPLHLSFTHFYACPILSDQLYTKEAITEGFERFSKTKQNFGK